MKKLETKKETGNYSKNERPTEVPKPEPVTTPVESPKKDVTLPFPQEAPKKRNGVLSVRTYSDKRLKIRADHSKVPLWHRIDIEPATSTTPEITTFYFHNMKVSLCP